MPDQAYRHLFETVSDALLIVDWEGRLLEGNPAAGKLFGRPVEELARLRLSQLTAPDSAALDDQIMAAGASNQELQTRANLIGQDGMPFQAELRCTPFRLAGRDHSLLIIRDIGQVPHEIQVLQRQIEEQARRLSVLLNVSGNVASTLEIEPLLKLIIDQIRVVTDFSSAGIYLIDGDDYYMAEYQGLGRVEDLLKMRFPRSRLTSAHEVERLRKPIIIGDFWTDDPQAEPLAWRVRTLASPQEMAENPHALYHSWLGVPLMVKDKVIGVLRLDHMERFHFSEKDAELVLALAEQAAIAIENARLFEAKQRRAEQFRIISEVGQRITSILSLDELLGQTVSLIQEAFGYYHVHIGLIGDGLVNFAPQAGTWQAEAECRCCTTPIKVGDEALSGQVAASGRPILVPDNRQDARYVPPTAEKTGSSLILPLTVKGAVIGVLNVESERLNAFDADDLIVMQLLANQIATAIDNARLYEQAQQLASLQERQKLARDLHDSVAQALYGIALGARTARVQLDRSPSLAVEPVEYVVSLAEAGLADMRALIFELRPESLETEGLVAALEKQADVLRARHFLEVHTSFMSEPETGLEAKQVLYRVAQEAVHNIVKHARASHAFLSLQQVGDDLVLEVRDDGIGFDVTTPYPGHLGLVSMRERAAGLGGNLRIESQPGQGTAVVAVLHQMAS
jgi:PAS domain S-box-containing protein